MNAKSLLKKGSSFERESEIEGDVHQIV